MSELRQRGPAAAVAAKEKHVAATSSSTPVTPSPTSAAPSSSLRHFALACLLLLLPLRVLGSLYLPIQDCDETFNYWEPLHYLMFGRGLQTWEYSPLFGLRSYAYLWIISPVGWAGKWAHEAMQSVRELGSAPGQESSGAMPAQEVDKLVLFYAMRLSFAVACACMEAKLLRTIRRVLGVRIAHWSLLFLACSAGLFHASSAFLPQTFTMLFVMATLDAWMRRDYQQVILGTGVCSLVGWPFSVLLSIPAALEIVWEHRQGWDILRPIRWGLKTLALCVVPCLIVDLAYYRRVIFAVVNIAVYNSNSAIEHGANLFGKEPASFYFVNLALNFNVALVLAGLAPLLLGLTAWLLAPVGSGSTSSALGVLRWLLPFYLWLGIFLSMPHKEERFLFVVYPYLALCAAVAADMLQGMLGGQFGSSSGRKASSPKPVLRALALLFVVGVASVFTILSGSRVVSLLVNYRAPLQVWTAVHDEAQRGLVDPNTLPFPLAVGPEVVTVASGSDAAGATLPAPLSPGQPEAVNVCVGKEWYRFPAHFFLPTLHLSASSDRAGSTAVAAAARSRTLDYTLRFLNSDFGGLLPKAYLEEWEHEASLASAAAEREKEAQVQREEENERRKKRGLDPLPAPKPKLPFLTDLLRGQNLTMSSGLSSSHRHRNVFHSVLPHLSTRPGTWRLPSGMNDLNRKDDSGRFVVPARCHYIVDFELPAGMQREPVYSDFEVILPQQQQVAGKCVKGWRWEEIFSAPFLDAAASPSAVLRAFYVPAGYSQRANVQRPYQLLKRVPIEC